MKIGFDFDKVFIDYPPFFPPSLINRIYKKQGGKALQYRIPKKPEQLIRITTHFSLFRPVIKKIGIQRYVDDDLELLEYLTGKNPTINFFWLNPSKKGKIKNRLSAIKD